MITSVTASGCDSMITCEPSISVMSALARSAIERTRSAPAALSPVATTAHVGSFFQAGGPFFSENAASAIGRCVAPIIANWSSGRSEANASRTFGGSIANSTDSPPFSGKWCGTSALSSTLSFEVGVTSPRASPSSGAKAATNTSPTTFFASVAALEMTAPPYECATSSTGPGISSSTPAVYAESISIPRSGFAGAVTSTPFSWSRSITPFQLDASAKAPCTSTTVGCFDSVMASVLREVEERPVLHDDVRGELGCVPLADVAHGVPALPGHRQRLAAVDDPARLAVDLVLERSVDHVDHFLARVPVLDRGRVRSDVDAVLDHLASRDAEVVLLEVGPGQTRNLLGGHG